MPKRVGAVHVAVTRRHYKGKVYESIAAAPLLPQGRQGPHHETVGNLSHLPPHVIDAGIRAMLAGKALVDLDQEL